MRRFYKPRLWIPQHFLLTNPNLHHGLLGKSSQEVPSPSFTKNRCGSPVKLLLGFRNKKFSAHLSRTESCSMDGRSEQAGAGRDQSQRIALADEVNGCKKHRYAQNVTNAQAIPLTSNGSPEIGRANEGDSSPV